MNVGSSAWWAVPILSGIFALVGVALGQGVLIRNERWKGRREDERRWHNTRLELYLKFVDEFENFRDELESFATDATPSSDFGLEDVKNLGRLVNHIRLISTEPVYDAASRCGAASLLCTIGVLKVHEIWWNELEEEEREAVRNAEGENFPDGITPPDLDFVLHDEREEMRLGILEFADAVRSELGVPGPTVLDDNTSEFPDGLADRHTAELSRRLSASRHPSRQGQRH